QDTIWENRGNDRIVFGEGINSGDLMFSKNGNNLIISVARQENQITISNYYCDDGYKVESVQTADGTEFDYTRIELMVQAMAAFEEGQGMAEAVNRNLNEQTNDASRQMWMKSVSS
ncbi:MAG: hypothetical protein NC124_17635, partial [Clostridium sp.]|nr:hypothetical protein [Clostridium sp.]